MLCDRVASLAYAQATSTFNGRVLDQGDAVLPGVTVTATNTATGVVRTTVTNAEGQYLHARARARRLRRQDRADRVSRRRRGRT